MEGFGPLEGPNPFRIITIVAFFGAIASIAIWILA